MKIYAPLVLLISCLLSTSVFAQDDDDFNGEFFQGMESGFFLRDTDNGHREYECPDPIMDTALLAQINKFLGPVQALLGMTEQDMIIMAVDSLDTIIKAVVEIEGVITPKYRGSEFCQGLVFGSAGTNLVLKLGKIILAGVDTVALYDLPTPTFGV